MNLKEAMASMAILALGLVISAFILKTESSYEACVNSHMELFAVRDDYEGDYDRHFRRAVRSCTTSLSVDCS